MNVKNFFSTVLLIALCCFLALIVYSGGADTRTPEASPSPSPTSEAGESPSPAPEPTPSPSPTPTQTPTPSPTPTLPAFDLSSWQLRLVNADHPLDTDFEPELSSLGNSQRFDSRAVEYLNAFMSAAKSEGLSVYLSSSYRTYSEQKYLFDRKVSQMRDSGYSGAEAEVQAVRIVARPGTSEHQLGLAADITDQYYDTKKESLADTALLKWMAAHCAEYGFILRYPKDKQEITGVMFEPWHVRYVGAEAAAYITENGLCLEEFWALYE